jgi:hypothetical protein
LAELHPRAPYTTFLFEFGLWMLEKKEGRRVNIDRVDM